MFSNIKPNSSLVNSLHSTHAKKESDNPENTLKCLLTNKTDQDGKNTDQEKKKKKQSASSLQDSLSKEAHFKEEKASLQKEEVPKKDFLKLLNVI